MVFIKFSLTRIKSRLYSLARTFSSSIYVEHYIWHAEEIIKYNGRVYDVLLGRLIIPNMALQKERAQLEISVFGTRRLDDYHATSIGCI